MSTQADAPEGTEQPNGSEEPNGKDQEPQTFTQVDVDRIVKERVQRERAKYADYDDLKTKAAGAKTLEDRIGELELLAATSETKALRAEIANAYGISAEDRDLFLTAADEETLTTQAKRLADRDAQRKQQGNVSPREGTTKSPGVDPKREWLRSLRQD